MSIMIRLTRFYIQLLLPLRSLKFSWLNISLFSVILAANVKASPTQRKLEHERHPSQNQLTCHFSIQDHNDWEINSVMTVRYHLLSAREDKQMKKLGENMWIFSQLFYNVCRWKGHCQKATPKPSGLLGDHHFTIDSRNIPKTV